MGEDEKAICESVCNHYGMDFIATAVWVAKEVLSKLFGYGFSIYDIIKIPSFEQEELIVKFTELSGFSVVLRPYKDYIFGFAIHDKYIKDFCSDHIIVEETELSSIIRDLAF